MEYNAKEDTQVVLPQYNFYSPYMQAYMQAWAARPPMYFPQPTIPQYGAQPGAPGYPGGQPQNGAYPQYPGQPGAPADPNANAEDLTPPVIRRRVRQRAVIFFAGLFALAALALSAFFFYVKGNLIPDFLDAFDGVSGFAGIFNVLGDNVITILVLGAAVFGLGAVISALVGFFSKKWQPVVIFTILAFLAFAAACVLDYLGDGLFDLLVIKEAYPYYCVAAAYLFSMVISWFCYPKRKFVLEEM